MKPGFPSCLKFEQTIFGSTDRLWQHTRSITQRSCALWMVVIVIFDVYRYREASGEASVAHTHTPTNTHM